MNERKTPMLSALALKTFALSAGLAGLLALAACVPPPAAKGPERMFTVAGRGEARAAPDIASISAGVRTEAASAREALSLNNRQMDAVFKAMREAGIEEKDIQTSNFSVNPVYPVFRPDAEGPQVPRIVGYTVFNQVTVTVRDLAKLGDILDTFVTVGANELYGIQFGLSAPKPLQDKALELAIADARAKAELMAKAAGLSLGRIVTLSESGASGRPMPVAMARMDAAAESVPVAAGEQMLEAYVSITFELD